MQLAARKGGLFDRQVDHALVGGDDPDCRSRLSRHFTSGSSRHLHLPHLGMPPRVGQQNKNNDSNTIKNITLDEAPAPLQPYLERFARRGLRLFAGHNGHGFWFVSNGRRRSVNLCIFEGAPWADTQSHTGGPWDGKPVDLYDPAALEAVVEWMLAEPRLVS
jgi:hypothetical protein